VLSSLRERLAEARSAFASVFTNPSLRRLELAWAGSDCAYWIFIITLSLYAYERGGASALGLVGLLRVLPSVVATPFVAGLGDRYPRERVLVAINLGRTATIAGAAVAAYANAPAGIVYALASLMGLLQSTFRPTQSALLPLLARSPEELTAANLALTTIEGASQFVGPALGGVLLAAIGTDGMFAATAGVFFVSALLLAGVRTNRAAKPAMLPDRSFGELFAGFRTVGRDPFLRLLVGLYGSQTLVAGALNVLIVVAALKLVHLGDAGIGYLNSAVGVGALVGGLGALALVGRARLASAFGIGLLVLGAPIALMGVSSTPAAALVLLGVAGVGVTIVDVAGVTLLQRAVPDEVLTRVMGVVQSVFVGTLGLGAVLAPVLISTLHIRGALVATGAFLAVLAVLAWPRLRALDTRTAAPAHGLDRLRAIPLFRPLAPAMIEQLAAHLVPVRVPAGEEIVREGEPGDRFYVIDSGEVDVSVDGRPGKPLRAGDHFGEIALLQDVPRTATVRAQTDVDLLALDRDEFLGAVTGNAESAQAAHAVVAERLSSLRAGIASV
jgi:MFS family permease